MYVSVEGDFKDSITRKRWLGCAPKIDPFMSIFGGTRLRRCDIPPFLPPLFGTVVQRYCALSFDR